MRTHTWLCMAGALLLSAGSAGAALQVGGKAPSFTTQAALAGKEFTFSLADALKRGPVVLYFFPAAFTPGCTQEAHEFAEATDKFTALGATVIGVTAGNPNRVTEFSSVECRNKFAVAADPDEKIIKSYDAVLTKKPEWSDRTSYVIAPDGSILMSYTNLDPSEHVTRTLAAVKAWRDAHK
ncbi:MAG: peroxiredoxin [Alphaproteobacteria bacterium]|nr:peroxiredoxin [Alphaproteobacteria bacterium]MBV9061727.1 peroxiredoxin [Alphaproteobacteria bacterium]